MVHREKLEKFNLAIDEIVDAKFILADIKIGKLISVMAENDEIYYLLANVLKGFDFENESPKYLLGDHIELPTQPRNLVAFIFCLLVTIHDRRVVLYDFLQQYFLSDSINNSYSKFVAKIIIPFKEIIVDTIVGEGEKDLGPAPKTPTEILFDICRELQQDCLNYKGCSDAMIILGGMIEACRQNNIELYQALKCALWHSTKNRKFLKGAEDKLNVVEI